MKDFYETHRLSYDGAVDADGHILEPSDLWEKYIDPKFRDVALRIVKDENGLDELQICTAYRCNGQTITEMPGDTSQFAKCEPVYERVAGWTQATRGVTDFSKLPKEAQQYIARLEETSGVRAAIVSTGSERDHTIIKDRAIFST